MSISSVLLYCLIGLCDCQSDSPVVIGLEGGVNNNIYSQIIKKYSELVNSALLFVFPVYCSERISVL